MTGFLARTSRDGGRTALPAAADEAPELPGVDPAWHRWLEVVDADGVPRRWHLLDGAPSVVGPVRGTVLAVHGNPTWSFLWRETVRSCAAVGWRVVAVDQLDMGWSERTGTRRRLARRIEDLLGLTDALGLSGPDADPDHPVVTLGHDWGGLVSTGWAGASRDRGVRLAGVVLTNTAVHQPLDVDRPLALELAGAAPVIGALTVRTAGFVRGTLATARRPLAAAVRAAYLQPYRRADLRGGVGAFVADIPDTAGHPSRPALERIAAGVSEIGATGVPSLLLWGPRDPVFQQRFFEDLHRRLPGADVHRFEGAGHLLPEDADVAGVVARWLDRDPAPAAGAAGAAGGQHAARAASDAPPFRPMTAALAERSAADPDGPAVVQLHPGGRRETTTWGELARRVDVLAAGLLASGVRPGDRMSLLVRPGGDLTALLYANLRLGVVSVVADAGLGLPGLTRAVRGAAPQHLAAVHPGLGVAWVLGWPGARIAVGASPGGPLVRAAALRLTGAQDLSDVEERGRRALAGSPGASGTGSGTGSALPPVPDPEAEAVVIFTSGSTGPAKGVVYTHRQMAGMRDALAGTYGIGPDTALVAAFAPFALLGPGLGATSSVPETDVTKPSTLTAAALADAATAVGAAAVFASPAALANVVATEGALTDEHRAVMARVRLLLSAGAPVDPALFTRAAALFPAASAHTPYGMTEALPIADVSLEEILAAGTGDGVLVGRAVPGAVLAVAPLDDAGAPTGALTDAADRTGEIAVRAPHVKDRYDQLWDTQRLSAQDAGWHRTGDVGRFDAEGRLWVQGRLAHVVTTAGGVVTPVGSELRAQALDGVFRAAVVGVGPAGTQQVVVVLEPAAHEHHHDAEGAHDHDGEHAHDGEHVHLVPGPAPLDLLADVRAAVAPVPVAAVLVVDELPTDIRHRSKIDRARVAAWASEVLAGDRSARTRP